MAREDYLALGGEPPGVWYNGEAIGRKTRDTIKKGELPRVLGGQDADGTPLLRVSKKKPHRAGLDLVFAAPKTVSIAWALADDDTRRLISKLGEDSVFDTLDFLAQQGAAIARRGQTGSANARYEPVTPIAGVYEHSSTRAPESARVDPHLHWHANVANMARRADGTVGTLELAGFLDWQKAGGAIFRAQFAKKLADNGFNISQDLENPWGFNMEGIPETVVGSFSQRHQQIVEEAGEFSSVEARNLAQKKTRAKKEEDCLRQDNLAEWRERSQNLGFSFTLDAVKGAVKRVLEAVTPAHFKDLVEADAVFTRAKLYTAVANYGVGVWEKAEIDSVIKNFEGTAFTTLKRDKKLRNMEFMTTVEFRAVEKRLLDVADALKSGDKQCLPPRPRSQRVYADGKPLTHEQHTVFDYVTNHPGRLKLVVGWAGTGKSFTMRAVKDAYEAQGFHVIGAAFSGKAAEELEKGSGIPTRTLDSRILAHKHGGLKLDEKTVVVVDEAGMAGTRHIEALLRAIHDAGAKVILLGDNKQLKPISAGNPFELLIERFGAVELQQVFRQKVGWFARCIKAVGKNSFTQVENGQDVHYQYNSGVCEGMRVFDENGLLHRAQTDADAKTALVDAYTQDDTGLKDKLLLAYKRRDVHELNTLVRQRRRDAGEIPSEEIPISVALPQKPKSLETLGRVLARDVANARTYTTETRHFSVGDSIILLENAYGTGKGIVEDSAGTYDVKNGTLGTVTAIVADGDTPPRLTVQLGDRTVTLDTNIYKTFDHGYAITVHKSQGSTVDSAYLLLTPDYERNLLYVGVSRAKHKTVVAYSKDAAVALVKETVRRVGETWERIKNVLTDADFEKALFQKVEKSPRKINTVDIKPLKPPTPQVSPSLR